MMKFAKTSGVCVGIGVLALAISPARAGDCSPSSQDIVQTASAAGQFRTLVQAIQAAGLADTLSGTGPFTVFAPTDEAFAKLPPGALDGLLKNPEALKGVLLYHVVPGKVMAADVSKIKTAKTALGQSLQINATRASGSTVPMS